MPGHWVLGNAGIERDVSPPAVLLAVTRGDADDDETSLAELARLADMDGLDVVGQVTQALRRPDPATFIGAAQVPELLVLNKSDCVNPEALAALRRAHPRALLVSAVTGEGLDALRNGILDMLWDGSDGAVPYPSEASAESAPLGVQG